MRVIQDDDGTILVTQIGRGWLRVTRDAWASFLAAVKRGEFDPHD